MTQPTHPDPDPLIDEVRQRRAELYASLGGDLRKLFEAIQRLQREHPEKVAKPRPFGEAHLERSQKPHTPTA